MRPQRPPPVLPGRGFIGDGVCSTISPPPCRVIRIARFNCFPRGGPMLELNMLISQIKNMQERVDALRGYL